jgi:Xaa-Pro aminopeptidase
VALRGRIAQALRGVRLVELPRAVGDLRLRKDASEVRAIGRAIGIAEAAFAAFRRLIRPGMTEERLAAELDHALRLAGSEGSPFPTICAVEASASRPHARPGGRRLGKRGLLLVDFGARAGGYASDLTRCLFAGKIPPHIARAYEVVLAAQEAGIRRAGPRVPLVEVDAAARAVMAAAGLGPKFAHGTGHGLGLEVHEPPALGPTVKEGSLQAGMVVTIEPGVYLRGEFGIRIEDDVLVTGRGRRVLSGLPKTLEAMVL